MRFCASAISESEVWGLNTAILCFGLEAPLLAERLLDTQILQKVNEDLFLSKDLDFS